MASRAQPENYNLESVARAVSVLLALEANGGATLDRVAHATGLSESTALRYLSSLATHDLVERDQGSGAYRLGLSLFRLGAAAMRQRDIVSVAAPFIDRLVKTQKETVNLAARRGNQVLLLQVHKGPESLRHGAPAGGIDEWHSTSLGKAILSTMPDDEVAALVRPESFVRFTPNTIGDVQGLTKDLGEVRARGYALDDEESEEGMRCVGVPIPEAAGSSRFALSISGPKSRMPYSRLAELGAELCDDARRIAAQLGVAGW